MQRRGLEWVFRLVQEPRRLWKRYLVTNTQFVVKLANQLVRQKFNSVIRPMGEFTIAQKVHPTHSSVMVRRVRISAKLLSRSTRRKRSQLRDVILEAKGLS